MELGQRLEHEGCDAGPPDECYRQGAALGQYPCVVNRKQPRAALRGAGDPHRTRRGCRGIVQPAVLNSPLKPETIVPRRLLRFGAHQKAGRVFWRDHSAASGFAVSWS
jgi:hypothetical protein